MNKVEGLHHLADCTADMKGQIEFFTDNLGMELVALYWMGDKYFHRCFTPIAKVSWSVIFASKILNCSFPAGNGQCLTGH